MSSGGVLLDSLRLDGPTRWLLVVAVGLTIFYAVMRPLRKKKDPLSRSGGLAGQRAVERDMNNVLLELSEMARKVTAQLDTRTMKLEMLIKEADERIAQWRDLAAHAPPQGNGNGVFHPASPAAPPAIDPRHQEVYELADQRLSSQQIAGKLSRPRGEIDLILALRDRSENI